jgi:HEPN domain-containing protein
LANTRLREAKALLAAGDWSGAYYLAGYAVECALKAVIAKEVKRHDFPDKDRVNRSYTHKLTDLAMLARLDAEIAMERKAKSGFAAAWATVTEWDEKSRYAIWTADEAWALVDAVGRRKDGVLIWVKQRW